MTRVTLLREPSSGNTIPGQGGSEPFFSDNPADVLIWEELWAGYTLGVNPDINTGGWSRGGNFSTKATLAVDTAFPGGRGLAIAKAGGEESIRFSRSIPGLPAHYFESYLFKFASSGDYPNGKQHIIEHDAIVTPVDRWQWFLTSSDSWHPSQFTPSRWFTRGYLDAGGAGPTTGGDSGYFVWTGAANADEPLPILASDPDIGRSPVGAWDDGAVHRMTIEMIANSTPGASGDRVWIDGELVADAIGTSAMYYAGRPTSWKYDTVSQPAANSTAYTMTFGTITVWKRV